MLRSIVALSLLVSAGWAARAAPRPFEVAPPGDWVRVQPLDEHAPFPEGETGGVYDLLMDRQWRVGDVNESYQRRARAVLTSAGVEDAAEIRIDFEPTYQKLVLHHAVIRRAGATIDALQPDDIKVIQQESGLEERIYNGSLTALLFLKDVRPGDILDWAYTIAGANPILDGRFVSGFYLADSFPMRHVHASVLWPKERTLGFKANSGAPAPVVEDTPSGSLYTWEAHDTHAIEEDDDTPPWYEPWPWVQLTEFVSWNDVARWSSAMFDVGDAAGPKALAATLSELPTEEARILAAVRFVQDDVRYLGIEIGPSSHRPHAPAQVLDQRYGDCKDKALLLTALLRELHVDADPALVSTRRRRGLDAWLPSPSAFDHVIVRVTQPGRTIWIDATASQQGGSLSGLAAPAFERALVVRPDTDALAKLPRPNPPAATAVVEETYRTTSYDLPTQLEVKSTFTGRDADRKRALLSSASRESLARSFLDFYAHEHPGAQADGAPTFEDDRAHDVVRVTERYKLPKFWKDGECNVRAWAVAERLEVPSESRTMPLSVPFPLHLRHHIVMELPEEYTVEERTRDYSDDGLSYTGEVQSHGTRVELTYAIHSKADVVPAAKAAQHAEVVREILEDAELGLKRGRGIGATSQVNAEDAVLVLSILGGAFVVVGSYAGIKRFFSGRRRRSFARLLQFTAGTAPGNAIAVPSIDDIAFRLVGVPCRCGVIPRSEGSRDSVQYGGRRLTVVSRSCEDCGRRQDLYFDVSG